MEDLTPAPPPRNRHVTRRRVLGFLAAGTAAAIAYPFYCDPRWLDVTRHSVLLHGKKLGDAVRVLHLSDLHASLVVPMDMIDHAVTAAIAQKPDVICLTGDYVTNGHHVDNAAYIKVLSRLSTAAPTFAVLGNHDARGTIWTPYRKVHGDHHIVDGILRDSGIEILHNRSTQVQVRDARLTLVGVGDLWTHEVDGTRAFAGVDVNHPTLLLAHNPDTKDVVGQHPWDLMLSGHTHGGQVRIPLEGSAFAPVKDKRYVAGLKPWEGRQIFVTRGVGNIDGVRFRCRPEVSVLDLA